MPRSMSDSESRPASPPVSLQALNTMGLPCFAQYLVRLTDSTALPALSESLVGAPKFILGGGSNVVISAEEDAPLPATVILNQLMGIVRLSANEQAIRIRCAAGEPWHRFVMWTLAQGWAGLENLALIPGTVGAAPIQNIGAYGVEVAECIELVHAWDFEAHEHTTFSPEACDFGYRSSRFKDEARQGPWNAPRFLITAVDFQLTPAPRATPKTDYLGLEKELGEICKGATPSPLHVAHAVMSLRNKKLPPIENLGNVGSFFQNPTVPEPYARVLIDRNEGMPAYPASDGQVKLSAGWLIEQLGFKGLRLGGAGVYDKHALVLVNHGQARAAEVLELALQIQRAVMSRFGVWLVPEPQLVPPRSDAARLNTGRSGDDSELTKR